MKTTLITASFAACLLIGVVVSCDTPVIAEGEGEGSAGEGEGSAGEGEGAAGEGEGAAGEGEGAAGEGEGEGQFGSCSIDADCDAVCGAPGTCTCQQGFCQPPQQTCTTNGDCPNAPFNACDLGTGQCTFGNCTNGGVTCDAAAGETCTADGRCIAGSGNPCATDDECPVNEFCSVGFNQQSGVCATGCRSSADCNNGQVCSGGHTCVDSAGAFNAPCADAQGNGDDNLCGPGLFCFPGFNTCQERCTAAGGQPEQCAGGACCLQSASTCCLAQGFCSNLGC